MIELDVSTDSVVTIRGDFSDLDFETLESGLREEFRFYIWEITWDTCNEPFIRVEMDGDDKERVESVKRFISEYINGKPEDLGQSGANIAPGWCVNRKRGWLYEPASPDLPFYWHKDRKPIKKGLAKHIMGVKFTPFWIAPESVTTIEEAIEMYNRYATEHWQHWSSTPSKEETE